MKRIFALAVFSLMIIVTFVMGAAQVDAGPGMPPDRPDRGMVYKGLEIARDGACKGGFQYRARDGKLRCTHGPDISPKAFLASMTSVSQQPPVTTAALPVTCDGDGTTGKRVQVIYAHPSTVPDSYATYLNSFKYWAQDSDMVFHNSAVETGGDRHVRYVTDSACFPVVADVTLSATGADTFVNMVNELQAQGYNRSDRKYMVFVDANVYCGISDIQFDDSAAQTNLNNQGPNYARADAQCWSTTVAAHELMHTLGGVQLTAPHSSLDFHCTDQDDLMCRPTNGIPTTQTCAWQGYLHFDCNHDDYYSTNPPANSYLATHWNTANSSWLINPAATVLTVNSMQTGKLKGRTFTATTTFKSGDTVTVQARVVNGLGQAVSGANVNLNVLKPDGTTMCATTGTSDSNGIAQGSCNTPRTAPAGNWDARLTAASKSGFNTNLANAPTNQPFTVQKK